jgi:hypothetical protein
MRRLLSVLPPEALAVAACLFVLAVAAGAFR